MVRETGEIMGGMIYEREFDLKLVAQLFESL